MTEFHPENGEQCNVGPAISIRYYGPATFAHHLTLNLYAHANESNTLRPSETDDVYDTIAEFYRTGEYSESYGVIFSEQPWRHVATEYELTRNWYEPWWGYTPSAKNYIRSYCRVEPGEYMFEVMEGYDYGRGIFGTPRLHCFPTWYSRSGYVSTGVKEQWMDQYLEPWSGADQQLFNDHIVTVSYPERNETHTVIDFDGAAGLPIHGDHLCFSRNTFSVCDFDVAESLCQDNPCGERGLCVPSCSDFECECTAEFEGKTCQFAAVDDCIQTPCHNGGTCVDAVSSGTVPSTGYTCMCPAGFHGGDCQQINGVDADNEYTLYDPRTQSCGGFGIELHIVPARQSGWARGTAFWVTEDRPRMSDILVHETGDSLGWYDGVCSCERALGNTDYWKGICGLVPGLNYTFRVQDAHGLPSECRAKYGFDQGSWNVSVVEPTRASSVLSDTSWLDVWLDDEVWEDCIIDYSFTPCNWNELCDSQTCLNGGTCIAAPGTDCSPSCACMDGFDGEHCGVTVGDVCATVVCLNGGTCTADGPHASCACPPGFVGELCEQSGLTAAETDCPDGFTSCPAATCDLTSTIGATLRMHMPGHYHGAGANACGCGHSFPGTGPPFFYGWNLHRIGDSHDHLGDTSFGAIDWFAGLSTGEFVRLEGYAIQDGARTYSIDVVFSADYSFVEVSENLDGSRLSGWRDNTVCPGAMTERNATHGHNGTQLRIRLGPETGCPNSGKFPGRTYIVDAQPDGSFWGVPDVAPYVWPANIRIWLGANRDCGPLATGFDSATESHLHSLCPNRTLHCMDEYCMDVSPVAMGFPGDSAWSSYTAEVNAPNQSTFSTGDAVFAEVSGTNEVSHDNCPRDMSRRTCAELGWTHHQFLSDMGQSMVCATGLINASAGSACSSGTFSTALRTCATMGARMCSTDEILSDIDRGGECTSDQRIWSASRTDCSSGKMSSVSHHQAPATAARTRCDPVTATAIIWCCAVSTSACIALV